MTTQPKDLMTLEKTIANLRLCLQAGVTSFGGSSLIRKKEVGELLASALHHLEVGRRDVRFSKDEAAGMAIRVEDVMNIMNAMLQGAELQTHPQDYKRQTLIIMAHERNRHLDYVAKKLKGGASTPTAQEVKETICPGCGKPSNHMESGTTSDHWGVWHGECEKQFWMAGTGLDDRVPPFSKRNVEVKEEPC